jgi:hypothetical protein
MIYSSVGLLIFIVWPFPFPFSGSPSQSPWGESTIRVAASIFVAESESTSLGRCLPYGCRASPPIVTSLVCFPA